MNFESQRRKMRRLVSRGGSQRNGRSDLKGEFFGS